VEDIYGVLSSNNHVVSEENKEAFGKDLANLIVDSLWRERSGSVLRMSALGNKCNRQMWFKDRNPDLEEDLPPNAKLKYLYGHILEHLLLFLAKEAGHEVTGEQDELVIDGVVGHRDAVIDGVTVDVKSASSLGFVKFREHKLETDDPFGYHKQIFSYVDADKTLKDRRGAFLAIDKQFGHICLDIYENPGYNYSKIIEEKRSCLKSDKPPSRFYFPVPDGKSGNMKLGVECSYCSMKNLCYPALRTFLYSSGPRFLTHVERLPDVTEVHSKGTDGTEE